MMGRTMENLLFPWYRKEEKDLADQMMDRLGILHLAGRHIRELSGGQQQRVFLARALVSSPQLLLLDEPTSGVASSEKFAVMETLIRALEARGVTSVFVEHDMEMVTRYASRVAVWSSGRIQRDGPPAEVLADPEVIRTVIGTA